MPVELRKRKTPPPAPVRPAKKKAASKPEKPKKEPKGAVEKAKAAVTETVEAVKDAVKGKPNGAKAESSATPTSAPVGAPKVGDTIDLTGFGGEVETHDGTKTTLAKLVEESKSGVVLFTYPKASTPGCTKQACSFRDNYTPLTATGFNLYGLSNDTPKSNTTFRTKQSLPYPLLCDPSRTLLSAIGLQGAKSATRGLFIVDKSGKVLSAGPGTPDGTVETTRKIIGEASSTPATAAEASKDKEDVELAKTASEVADTAAKIDADKV